MDLYTLFGMFTIVGLFVIYWWKANNFLAIWNLSSGPGAIAGALFFLIVSELFGFISIIGVQRLIAEFTDSRVVAYIFTFIKILILLLILCVASIVAMRTVEPTKMMNVKIFAFVGWLPHVLLSLNVFSGVTAYFINLGFPIFIWIVGHALLKLNPYNLIPLDVQPSELVE
jgi:hypothetical protein